MAITNKYFIKTVASVTQAMIDQCVATDASLTRKSLDGLQCVLKGPDDGSIPSTLSSETVYDHTAILVIMAGVDWTDPNAI